MYGADGDPHPNPWAKQVPEFYNRPWPHLQSTEKPTQPRVLFIVHITTSAGIGSSFFGYYPIEVTTFMNSPLSNNKRFMIVGVEQVTQIVNLCHALEFEIENMIESWELISDLEQIPIPSELPLRITLKKCKKTLTAMQLEINDPRALDIHRHKIWPESSRFFFLSLEP